MMAFDEILETFHAYTFHQSARAAAGNFRTPQLYGDGSEESCQSIVRAPGSFLLFVMKALVTNNLKGLAT
jgi:hypothetical protein